MAEDVEEPEASPDPNSPSGEEEGGGSMSFLDHLEDLRGTLLRCALAFILGCALVSVALPQVADLLNWPLQQALGDDPEGLGGLVTTSPLGVFTVIIQVVFFGGLALSLPFMVYFVAGFIAPALTARERAVLRPGMLAVVMLFLLGATFSFFILLPAALTASRAANEMFGFRLIWSADRYYNLLVWTTVGVGASFEFPLILLLLTYVGILSAERLRAFRPYSVIVFLVVSAVVTPTTDPVTFLLLAAPLYVLYEISIFLAARLEGWKRRRDLAG